jgi:hypothetical protein
MPAVEDQDSQVLIGGPSGRWNKDEAGIEDAGEAAAVQAAGEAAAAPPAHRGSGCSPAGGEEPAAAPAAGG